MSVLPRAVQQCQLRPRDRPVASVEKEARADADIEVLPAHVPIVSASISVFGQRQANGLENPNPNRSYTASTTGV
jgi:hypothetical protein